ncbi:MAG TPA: DeoR/GlpR family DNA-binding transcription regulator [Solirubrobacteraceae bacterium]|nr:DeoR/GlpR family DNA-binding transcription regulator [Solirubrobacteraceae bacterium]
MHQSERLGKILEQLALDGSVSVVELARALDVSAATVRRDLVALESQRLLDRTHGGAVPQGVLYELPLRYKANRQPEQKRLIAQEAASRVLEGWAIGLTGGTTTTEVARALVDRQRLTVVTNALNIASEIAVRPNLKLVVTGGVARSESYELVGPIAEKSLEGLNLDIAFLAVDGISPRAGLTTHHEIEAGTDRALMARADQVVVVADSSKIDHVAFARICELSEVDELITDDGVDPAAVAAIEEAGVRVTLVPSGASQNGREG